MATTTISTPANTTLTLPNGLNNRSNSEVHNDTDSWVHAASPKITFLSVFIGFGFLGNLFLIITICHSRRFRSIAFYIFVSNLAIVNICECLLNMTVLLSVTIANAWTFGKVPCKVSAFFLHLICVETVLALAILTTDRLVAVRFKDKYEHVFSTPRISILVCYTWFQSLSFSIPVASGAVPTSANVYIKHCSITKGGPIAYGIISTILCVIVPLVLMIVFFVKITRTYYKDRTLIRSLISQHNYKDDSQPEPRIKTEIRYTNLSGTVCVAWLIMNGPYVATLYFNMLQSSSELDEVSDDQVKYTWYVDLVLLWLRFSFTLVLPIATFVWNKELWKSFKDMILCRKNNSVIDESFKKNETDTQKLERKIKEEEKHENDKEVIMTASREQRVFHVPVLFATSHGVHVKTVEDSDSDPSDIKNVGALRGKKCDVLGSQDNLNNLGDDTSDYDSGQETDQYSVSHPISVRQIHDPELLSGRHRSSSHPEVRPKSDTSQQKESVTVGSSSAGDSGLDLSTGAGNNTLTSPSHDNVRKSLTLDKKMVGHGKTNNVNNLIDIDGHTATIKSGDYNDNVTNDDAMKVPFGLTNSNGNATKSGKKSDSYEKQEESSSTLIEKIKPRETAVNDPPIAKRRKKKRKDRNPESTNQGTASPMLPLKPPPRLAPISSTSNTKTSHSGLGRPGSSCSSQYCSMDNEEHLQKNGAGLNSDSYTDFAKADLTSLDNLSLLSFTSRKCNSTSLHSNILAVNEPVNLDSKRKIKSVPEEIPASSECHVTDRSDSIESFNKNTENNLNESAHENEFGDESIENKHQSDRRNSEARKKRRERIISNSILNEGLKGYTRLKMDT